LKVRCIANGEENLLQGVAESEKLIATKYDITIGKIYTVYCMAIWNNCLEYCIAKGDKEPNWYSAELFEVRLFISTSLL